MVPLPIEDRDSNRREQKSKPAKNPRPDHQNGNLYYPYNPVHGLRRTREGRRKGISHRRSGKLAGRSPSGGTFDARRRTCSSIRRVSRDYVAAETGP